MLADASYLLAFALSLEVSPAESPSGLKPFALARARFDLPVELMLDWVTRARPGEPAPPTGNDSKAAAPNLLVRRLGSRPGEVLVTAFTDQELFAGFVDRLAERCDLRVQWTKEALAQTGTRPVTVAVEQMQFSALVQVLALDAELSWDLEGNTLSLSTMSQLSERTQVSRRLTARKAAQDALLTHPDHPLAAATYLELGNLEVASGRLKEGLSSYERLLRKAPRSRISAELYYNLALTRSQLGETTQARDAFFWVVDRAPGSELALLSYLQIGRLHLNENDPAAAIRPLRRAMSASSESDTRLVAALLLAAAQISTDSPRVAHATLTQMGDASNREPYRRAAALLDALARYRAQPDPRKAIQEAGNLLGAIVTYREEPILGPVGVLVAGRHFETWAYRKRWPVSTPELLRNQEVRCSSK